MEHDFLSKEQTARLKAILCILVVFAHSNSNVMREYGRVCVCVFFFLSGFSMAFTTWGKKISASYVIKKFANILIPYFMVEILYRILFHFYNVEGEPNTLKGTINGLLHFSPVVFAGWYIEVLILLFIIYFIAYKIAAGDKTRFTVSYLVIYVAALIYDIVYARSLPMGATAHFFLLGVLMHFYRDRIRSFYKKNYWLNYLMLLLPLLSFVFMYLIYEEESLLKNAAVVLFVNFGALIFFWIGLRVKFKSKALDIISKYSLFIYMTHVGIQYILITVLPLWGFKVRWIVFTAFLASFAIAFIVSVPLHHLCNLIKKPIFKLIDRR
ncbi:Fucose 4-O-acetylase [Oscillospiraceae bacterium]|nr:Fucose 4-O-acetylase [Oscillospiraceae bacterium]